MSQAPNQSPAQQEKDPSQLMATLSRAGRAIANNWGTKLLSLVLAIGLWVGLITQDPTLTREKTFRDVSVSVSGTDTLKRNGFIVVSDLEALLGDVTVVVDVPQKQYVSAQPSNYNIRVDLSRIRSAGEQEVAITGTSTATYGEILRISPARVKVLVEEYVSVGYIPVNVVMNGEMPAGFYAGNITCDPAWVTVSGPRSLVEQVELAEVTVELSEFPAREGDVRKALSFRLLDKKGQLIDDDMLQVTSDSVLRTNVNVSARIYARREIDVTKETLYYGRTATGYEVTDVIVSPETLSIAGTKERVDAAQLFNTHRALRISGASDTVEGVIDLGTPANLAWLSTTQFEVTVVIRPIQATRHFENLPVRVIGAGPGDVVSQQRAGVYLTGAAIWISSLPQDAVKLTCDVSGLSAGVHDVPVQCTVEGSEGQEFTIGVEPMTLRVTIAAEE